MSHDETGHYVIMLLEEEKVMLSGFSCSLFANYEERETCKEGEIYLDEKLVAAQSVLWELKGAGT